MDVNKEKNAEESCDNVEDAWRKVLNREQYHVMREKGTEPAFTGRYVHTKEKGMYVCAACGNPLFSSDAKFDSGTGWPSFVAPITDAHVTQLPDSSLSMQRTEVVCSKCGSHLGHVFNDGPQPTGKRFCINSVSLDLRRDASEGVQ